MAPPPGIISQQQSFYLRWGLLSSPPFPFAFLPRDNLKEQTLSIKHPLLPTSHTWVIRVYSPPKVWIELSRRGASFWQKGPHTPMHVHCDTAPSLVCPHIWDLARNLLSWKVWGGLDFQDNCHPHFLRTWLPFLQGLPSRHGDTRTGACWRIQVCRDRLTCASTLSPEKCPEWFQLLPTPQPWMSPLGGQSQDV